MNIEALAQQLRATEDLVRRQEITIRQLQEQIAIIMGRVGSLERQYQMQRIEDMGRGPTEQ